MKVSSRRVRPRAPRAPAVLSIMLLAAALVAGCERKPPEKPPGAVLLLPTDFDQLPGWRQDRVAEALPALLRSCARFEGMAGERAVGPDGLAGTVADWRGPCEALKALSGGGDAAVRASLERHFTPFAVTDNGDDTGVITGYYEPELRGALARDEQYRWPLYRRPDDLVTVELGRFRADLEGERVIGRVEDGSLVPYYTRAEIDDGALDGQARALLWLDDPVDAFFLHVQGSGRVVLPDDRAVRVGFAASNGRPFTAIGQLLIDQGVRPANGASMQGIREWLRNNPEEARAMMNRNARYIFFRPIEGEGPIGAQGVALTAGRSLAVDPRHLPLGVPLWLDTTWPGGERALRRLVVAQDTGGAIKGPVRGDLFWGSGEEALRWAGRMKQKGRYYLLLPRSVAERRTTTG